MDWFEVVNGRRENFRKGIGLESEGLEERERRERSRDGVIEGVLFNVEINELGEFGNEWGECIWVVDWVKCDGDDLGGIRGVSEVI